MPVLLLLLPPPPAAPLATISRSLSSSPEPSKSSGSAAEPTDACKDTPQEEEAEPSRCSFGCFAGVSEDPRERPQQPVPTLAGVSDDAVRAAAPAQLACFFLFPAVAGPVDEAAPPRFFSSSAASFSPSSSFALPCAILILRFACKCAMLARRIAFSGSIVMLVSTPPIFIRLAASVLRSELLSCCFCLSVRSASGPQKYFWWNLSFSGRKRRSHHSHFTLYLLTS
mmetsp:Transcript_28795/g.66966  ORF Transcript_28795/g.66966 Transcript_28795/m.66966 type:complete len:226 (+) Transcript_28795:1869-2546(+)